MSAAHRSVMRRNVSVIDMNHSTLGGRRAESRLPHLLSVSGHPSGAAAPLVPQTSRSAYDRRWFGFFSSRVRAGSSVPGSGPGDGSSGPGLVAVAGAGTGSGAGGSSFTLTSDGSTATVLDSASASSGGVMSRSYSVGDTELLTGPLNSFGSMASSHSFPSEGVAARPTVSLDAGVMVAGASSHHLGVGAGRARDWSHHYSRGVDNDDARSASSAHSDPGQRADSLRLGLGYSVDAKSVQAVDGRRHHHHHHHKHKAAHVHGHASSPHGGRLHRDSPRQRRHSGGALDTPLPEYGDMFEGEPVVGVEDEEEGLWTSGPATGTVTPTNAASSGLGPVLTAGDGTASSAGVGAGQGAGGGGAPRATLRSVGVRGWGHAFVLD